LLLRCDSTLNRNWIKIKLVGVKSNRTGIGSRVIVTAQTVPGAPQPLVQMDELRSGGSYFSQNDMRMHFGLDQAKKVDVVEIRWPSGQVDQLMNLDANQLYVIQEGGKIQKSGPLPAAKTQLKVKAKSQAQACSDLVAVLFCRRGTNAIRYGTKARLTAPSRSRLSMADIRQRRPCARRGSICNRKSIEYRRGIVQLFAPAGHARFTRSSGQQGDPACLSG
jgi:hypothetical protein